MSPKIESNVSFKRFTETLLRLETRTVYSGTRCPNTLFRPTNAQYNKSNINLLFCMGVNHGR